MLHHTATDHNTLQRAATHCNMTQRFQLKRSWLARWLQSVPSRRERTSMSRWAHVIYSCMYLLAMHVYTQILVFRRSCRMPRNRLRSFEAYLLAEQPAQTQTFQTQTCPCFIDTSCREWTALKRSFPPLFTRSTKNTCCCWPKLKKLCKYICHCLWDSCKF